MWWSPDAELSFSTVQAPVCACMCVFVYICTSFGSQTIMKATYRSFQSVGICRYVHTGYCTVCVCTVCPWVLSDVFGKNLHGGFCAYMIVLKCPRGCVREYLCECVCVCHSYQDTSASRLVESVFISPVFKPLLSDQSRGKAPGPLVLMQTFLSVFPSTPKLFPSMPFPLNSSYYLGMGD